MTTTNPYKHLDVHTNKGAADMVAGQSIGQGQPDLSELVTSGVFVDRETVTVDGDVYEMVDLSTDSTVDVLTFWNNTDTEITQTAIDPADYTFTVGEYVMVESECAVVTNIVVNSATDWDVSFYRGVAGTAVAAHATSTTAIEVDDGTALTAGAITVPAEDMTQAVGLDALAAIVGSGGGRGPFDDNIVSNTFGNVISGFPKISSPNWLMYNLDDLTGLLVSTIGGARGATVAEAGANMAWTDTTTKGGDTVNASPHVCVARVPTAAEVTAGLLHAKFNFHVVAVQAWVFTTATGAAVAWDGTASIVDPVSGVVSLDNGGLVDWAATDTVVIEAIGVPVAVANCAVVG